jgi:xanthine dehydrogenase iron-sulfur cluster and FAD-binding subunit A
MGGNICRCATYVRIKSAIKQAAGLTPRLTAPPVPRQIAVASTSTKGA